MVAIGMLVCVCVSPINQMSKKWENGVGVGFLLHTIFNYKWIDVKRWSFILLAVVIKFCGYWAACIYNIYQVRLFHKTLPLSFAAQSTFAGD